MRVISGTAGGRKLKKPAGYAIRPTSDMVKESLFNIIQFRIEGKSVLDLFAGTGQLGIEALSRGAARAVFVDSDPAAVKLIRGNLELCGYDGAADVYERDALVYLEDRGTFDIILIDPPYDTRLAAAAVEKIFEFDKINIDGIIVCETRAGTATPAGPDMLFSKKDYRYGGVMITLYERTGVILENSQQ